MPSLHGHLPSAEIVRLFASGSVAGLSDAQLVDRFAVRRDEAAFAALVARHGPMIVSVCRGVLRDDHAAEDAAQATFLVLARKADSLRVGGSLGGWLHRVGLRVAVEARKRSERARTVERAAAILRSTKSGPDEDLIAALHEEIGRLPDRYRLPVVLCDLQSLTRDEAASQLGCPPGTVAGRLARARGLLRDRLGRRGWVATGAMLGAALATGSARAGHVWEGETVRLALAFGSRQKAVETSSIVWAEEACRAMMRANLMKAAAMLAVALTAGIAFASKGPATTKIAQEPKVATVPKAAPAKPPGPALKGSVVGPDGKPAGDVRVYYSVRQGYAGRSRIVAESLSDASGQFRLDWPTAEADRAGRMGGTIWAYRPGSTLFAEIVPEDAAPEQLLDRITIGPPARAVFYVRSPDGRPVAGAKIKPLSLGQGYLVLPVSLAEKIEAEAITDAQGRAILTGCYSEQIRTYSVTAKGYGIQQFGTFDPKNPNGESSEGDPSPQIVSLLPVGRVKGRLVGPKDQIKGRRLTVTTRDQLHPVPVPGVCFLTTDVEGSFEVPEIAAGNLLITVEADLGSPWYGRTEPGLAVESGGTTEVEITLKRGVPVVGIVRERVTELPIAGVKIETYGDRGGSATTDAAGRFTGFLPPGVANVNIASLTTAYAHAHFSIPNGLQIPDGVDTFEIPPIELSPAGSIKGVATDERGEPLRGAWIKAAWLVDEGPNRKGISARVVRSGRDGSFVFARVPLDADAILTAAHQGLSTSEEVTCRAGTGKDVRLKLDAAHAASLSGRVTDADGRAIAGAKVRVRPRPSRYPVTDLSAMAKVNLVTNADGRFQTPDCLIQDESYAAFVEFEGYDQARTVWTKPTEGPFVDVKLAKESTPPAKE